MRLLSAVALLVPFLGTFARAQRKLPADIQVDLVFPRPNETYASTQWFPIVFAIRNLDQVWPLDALGLGLNVRVVSNGAWKSNNTNGTWWNQHHNLRPEQFAQAAVPTPGKPFYHTVIVSMTNATTDTIGINWSVWLWERCFLDFTDPRLGPDGLGSVVDHMSSVSFHVAPGAQSPDIEATVGSCPQLDNKTSFTFRVTEERKTEFDGPFGEDRTVKKVTPEGKPCSLVDTNIPRLPCIYQPLAKDLAANVSATILDKMGCKEGVWQDIKGRCPSSSMASSPGISSPLVWALGFACALGAVL